MPGPLAWQGGIMASCLVWVSICIVLSGLSWLILLHHWESRAPDRSLHFHEEHKKLRAEATRFRRLAENMRSIAWIVSMDGARTVFVNPAFERITGRSCQSLYDDPGCLDLIHPEDRARAVILLFRQVLENFQSDAEFRIVRPDNGLRWLRCRAFFVGARRGRKNEVACIAEDITEHKEAEEALHQATARLLHLQDEERRRLARELHDSTGQRLTALAMNLAAVQRSAGHLGKKARQVLDDSLVLVRQCSQEVRTISYLLHPPLLEELGLASALRNYLDGFTRRSGIRVTFEVPEDFPRLHQDVELALFRVVQESLTNIHRHSGSATARVKLASDASGVLLEVADQGRGIPPEMSGPGKDLPPGLGVGIAGMKERLTQVGGLLEIESTRHGTLVRAIVPASSQST